jgi:CHAT domain-containing protein/tetratricopeptide (TPR) repeat protein
LKKFILIVILILCRHVSEIRADYITEVFRYQFQLAFSSSETGIVDSAEEVELLNESLKTLLINGDYAGSKTIVNRILKAIESNRVNDAILAESYYFIGIYHSYTRNIPEAINLFKKCISLKEKNKQSDDRYSKALYNLGVIYSRLGDFKNHEYYSLKSLDVEKTIQGDENPILIGKYSSLITAYIELQEYEKAISYSNIALKIGNSNPGVVSNEIMAGLYNNLGACYYRMADFSKAIIFFEKSEILYKNSRMVLNENYINLLNNLAVSYQATGMAKESAQYYEKGIVNAVSVNSASSFNLINSYSIILGNEGHKEKGASLLEKALENAKAKFGGNSHNYFVVLNNYANYLREYKLDNRKALGYYESCLNYLRTNDHDLTLKNLVYIGYSLSLVEAGETKKALVTIQSLLNSDNSELNSDVYDNPLIGKLKPDKNSLSILRTKYRILHGIYKKSNDLNILEVASSTNELIVSLLEKLRINISDEESRLILGDNYRESYLNAIRDFNLLYTRSGDHRFLTKAFEFMEKSKVAVLLTSTRELKASQFHIPVSISDFEKRIQRDISLFNARIDEEITKPQPDSMLIDNWRDNLLKNTRLRDSLILVFEENFPEYYSLKYNTQVASIPEIPGIIGHNGNYINYVLSDSLLYIFVANRKFNQLLAINIDSAFFNNLSQFRGFLSSPVASENAKASFLQYQIVGLELYKTLISPIRPYLISDKIIISPDNTLSYLPFETIPTAPVSGNRITYNKLHYLMNDFNISYTYSATLMAESENVNLISKNKAIAFAPNYPDPIDINSVYMNRQPYNGVLLDLPYARQEAEFVSHITNGSVYLNDESTESAYKAESGKFEIIHLAMHTLLNDKDPMHSKLIFNKINDSIQDGYLNTYEVYGIPLKAKMVVLSSCNTGTGVLSSGEGILSLARGFIYSGSQSVVMSMWEIEDRSGTEIVESFYENLKKGYSKSVSLKRARIAYLKNSDQLRSHPYFWSSLVVYGNNAPLYYSRYLIILVIGSSLLIIGFLIYYFNRSKYS